ncbi:hypothetical protein EB796_022462 [Bugula neritina]|uniref:Uncharacterized protein n=1 Tax=Bugula neritina TaxID=10212 RepID=A0A7J7J0L8_BUGNE|nr:hypothetical protein EB796_022462 [Bugula neritina]
MGEESIFKVIGVIVLVIVGGVIGLICASFSDLQFYEMGFSKSKTTGAVNTAVVYKGGRRWIGPDRTFKIFDASAHDITLDDISVFAATDQVVSLSTIAGRTTLIVTVMGRQGRLLW